MSKKTIFMDLDDTILDTEGYIRKVLGKRNPFWMAYRDSTIYEVVDKFTPQEVYDYLSIMTDYSRIPYMYGARKGLDLLKNKYNIVIVTSCSPIQGEEVAKIKWGQENGYQVIICKGDNWRKDKIDMRGGVFVDNNTRNIKISSASLKIAYYQKWSTEEDYKGIVVRSWNQLLKELL